jgi:hypothetical protein
MKIFNADIGALDYRNTDTFNQFRNHYKQNVDKSSTPTFSSVITGLPNQNNSAQYYCGITIGTKAYFFPRNATQIMVVDSIDDSITFVGSFAGVNKFFRVKLAPNGYVYAFGFYGSTLKFNPKDNTYTSFGSDIGGYKVIIGDKIYSINGGTGVVGYLDTNTDKYYDLGLPSGYISGTLEQPILSIQNNLYFMRRGAGTAGTNRMCKLDLETFTYTYKNLPTNSSTFPFTQGFAHPNGKIYLAANTEDRWGIIDTLNNDSVSYSNVTVAGNYGLTKHLSCIMGANGNMYNFPYNDSSPGSNVEELNVDTDVSTVITNAATIKGTTAYNYKNWISVCLMPNGKIYGVASDCTGFLLKGNFNNADEFNEEFTKSQWVNNNKT